MTVDEFIKRLESLKTVDGVTGDTPVSVTIPCTAHNDFREDFEVAIAEVQNVIPHPTGPWSYSDKPEDNKMKIVRVV